ncbi:MAG: FecR domain-containing protein, partial [Odoribacter sp.]|nr:FecR domain-containing protein [Odoribacter sp.]
MRRLIRFDLSGVLSATERRELEVWLDASEEHRVFYQKVRDEFRASEIRSYLQTDSEEAWERVRSMTFGASFVHLPSFRRWLRYAAVVVPIVLSVSLWYVWEGGSRQGMPGEVRTGEESLPVLTLDNGDRYYLTPEEQTEIEVNDGIKAYKTQEGLVYDTTSRTGEVRYNHIRVPRGCEYQVVLADGTKVWLNAASELSYPVVFRGGERRVYLRGEGYFEVAPDKERPFYVKAGEVDVRVLGTAFNINTHSVKRVRTVLVRGAVELACGGLQTLRMSPGDLVDFNRETSEVLSRRVDVAPYISWKDGYFVFENETLEDIMNTLAL